jgi:hypothetical protein
MTCLSSTRRTTVVAALLCSLASLPATAGNVEVKFTEPEGFADAGRNPIDRERNLQTLAEHLQAAGARLPDGQTLKVEITDVDLAGNQDPFRFHDTRILRGRADWPRMSLRWTLQRPDGSSTQGEERLSDMNYLMWQAHVHRHDALPFEHAAR